MKRLLRARIVSVSALVAVLGLAASGAPAHAELGALMSVGAAFVGIEDVDRIADDLNFGSLSPGIDGGVQIQFGRIDRGWSGSAGLEAFWSRRRIDEVFYLDGTPAGDRSSFVVTALGFPASAVYSLRRAGGRLFLGAGVGYYAATVRARTDISGSNYFPNDGITPEGERSADGLGFHAIVGYERPTRLGGIGGGVRLRAANFTTDDARSASDFDVDLSGVSFFLSLSVRQAKT